MILLLLTIPETTKPAPNMRPTTVAMIPSSNFYILAYPIFPTIMRAYKI